MTQKQSFITKPMLLLAASHLITDLGQGALPALLPFLKTAFNLTYAQIGVVVLMQNLTSSVIQPIFGFVTDKISLPWLLPLSVLVSGVGMAVVGWMSSYYLLLAVVIIGGLGIAAFHPQASKAAHYVSSITARGRSMAIFSLGGNLGNALGSLFMTLLLTLPGSIDNTVYFILPASVMSVLLFTHLGQISPSMSVKHGAATRTDSSDRPPVRIGMLVVLLIFIFIRSSINTGLTTYIPLYYVNYLAGSPTYASYLLSVFLLAGAIGTFVGGMLSDRFGRKTVIIGSMLVTLPLVSLFQYTTGIITIILLAVTGTALISSFATTLVLSQEMMPGYEGMASGLTIGFSIGLGGIGATILGYIADHFSIPMVFTVLSVLPAVAIIPASFLPGKIFCRDNVVKQ